MKNISIFLLSIASTVCCQAQALQGIWEGKMNAGVELRMIFHFSLDDSNKFIATLDCPEQGIKDVKAGVILKNDSVFITIDRFKAKYSGRISTDSLITGVFSQGPSFPLNLRKINKVVEKRRSQTPVAPFPYQSEDLVYYNKDKSISYGATITIPNGNGPFPAVLLLTGSGQQNRDEEIMGHKPFAVIADHLTRNGFIVLRVDDRGMGNTTGDVRSATTRDFANDATISFEYLKNYQKVDRKRIGLIGHSEGGMIAQMLGAERSDVDFIIMLAAPGERNMKLMIDQNEAMLLKAGLPKDYVNAYLTLYDQVVSTILSSPKPFPVEDVRTVVDKWIAITPPNVVVATTGIKDEMTKESFVKQFVGQVGQPWFKYFLNYDPAVNIRKISASVLAINGDSDIQVIAAPNLKAIEESLKKGKSKTYEVKQLAGLNHLFQECKSCTINEYGQLEQTISPVMLNTVTGWLKKVQ